MLGTYFYHSIIRKTVVAFATLFNNIEIHRIKDDKEQVIKVPLAYGPREKFLSRANELPELNDSIAITLPRMSFEIQDISYDNSRKLSPVEYIRHTNQQGDTNRGFMPIPYNIAFELSILSRYQDDSLQILEQILPFFQPSFTITMNLVPELAEKRDFPVTLTSVNYIDDYTGSYDKRRALVYVLTFLTKTYLYGPILDKGGELIKHIIIDFHRSLERTSPRESRISITPTSTIDRDGVDVTTTSLDITTTNGIIYVNDSSIISNKTIIDINNESMYVSKKEGNKLYVFRGWNNTAILEHAENSIVRIIDSEDHKLLNPNDDFGFSEIRTEYTDGKSRDPITGTDI